MRTLKTMIALLALPAALAATPASAQLRYDLIQASNLGVVPATYYGGFPGVVTFPQFYGPLKTTPDISLPLYNPYLRVHALLQANRRQAAAPQTGGAIGVAREGRYYLDPVARPKPAEEPAETESVSSLLDQVKRQIRVEGVEPGLYSVRWLGPTENVTAVEFRALDGADKVLDTQTAKEAPYQVRLKVGADAERIEVRVQGQGGSSATLGLPAAEFRSLDAR
jgi:hypothetical protein